MKAELKRFGHLTQEEANEELALQIGYIHNVARGLQHNMELLEKRIQFENGEAVEWLNVEMSLQKLQQLQVDENKWCENNLNLSHELKKEFQRAKVMCKLQELIKALKEYGTKTPMKDCAKIVDAITYLEQMKKDF